MCVKQLLVRQELFHRTVDEKKWEQKIPEKLFGYFWIWLQKRMHPKNLDRQKEQKLLKSSKEFAAQK